jgi:hypothetical protein
MKIRQILALGGFALLWPVLPVHAAVQPVSFGTKTDFGTGSGPSSVAVGDFNGDGKPDLAVTNASSANVSILLGTGTGSFGTKTNFGTGSFPASVAVGDFNGDGKLDLAVANASSNTVSILRGTGTGSFGAKIDFGAGSFPSSVAVGDFNGDGKLDLAVANLGSATVSILLGTGTGSFGAKTDFGAGTSPESVAMGDFNGDGKLDLAVANGGSATVSILLGIGTGSFGAKTDFGAGDGPESVAVGDFNGDGRLDLAVANVNSSTVSILLGTGTGSFGTNTDFGTGGSPGFPVSVAVGDFNGDGQLDLAVANQNSSTVSILLGTGTGSFGPKTEFGTGSKPSSVALGDFNGDGKFDLAVANRNSDTVSILLNTTPIAPSGVFCPKSDFGTGGGPSSVAVGDFNGDGNVDLAVANTSSDTVSILLGMGTGSLGAKTDFGTGDAPQSVAVGDFNGDGKLDLAVVNFNSDTVSILLGTGTGSFGAKTDFGTGDFPTSVAVGDFNGDGKLDLAVPSFNTATVSILLGTGTGSFGTKTDFGTGSEPLSVAVGDFNGDGKLDLAVANQNSDTVSILLGTGTGSFGAKTDFSTGSFPESVAMGDFNRDGKLDLAVANFSSDTVSILLGTGTGSFGAKTDFSTGAGSGPNSVAVGDLNGDGQLDLAVANFSSNTVSILLGTGTGSFGANTNFGTGAEPIPVAVGDFYRDGKLDLVVANFNSDNVSILLNNTAPSITAVAVNRTAGNPSANSQVALVDDAQSAPNTLSVTVDGGSSATVNGVTVTLNPTAPNTSGQVFADVVAACNATTATFMLRVTDSCGLITETPLTVDVSANPAPILTYNNASVVNGGSTTINPASGPSDNLSVATIVVQSTGTYTGTISVDNVTGIVSISNAAPRGSHTITIRATDSCGLMTDAPFTLTVTNHLPYAPSQFLGTNEDIPRPITLTGKDADGDALTFSIVSNPAHGMLSGTPPNLSYTPNADYDGSDSFTFKANDGAADSNTATISITVFAVNDAPSFTKGPDQTVAQNSGPQLVPNWATNISAGPANESGQSVMFMLSNNNASLFSSQPAITPNGTLSYTPAPGASGSATITVLLKDNGGTAQGGQDSSAPQTFTITVTAAPPSPTATATATPTTTATATATATPTATATATATPTATPAASPSATPRGTPSAAQALNLSTRLRVDTGEKVMIGGFIVTGEAAKSVVLRGMGPSLVNMGIPAASVLNDPVIELHGSSGALVLSNDNWKESPQRVQIEGTVFEPGNDREAVILATLPPAAYTVILKGAGGTAGIGLVEAYDTNATVDSELANVSTRGFVETGANVMIGGFMLGGNPNNTRIAIRGLGPSLASAGLTNLLADPTLELHNGDGTIMISNDNWQDNPVSAAALTANGLAPTDMNEAAIFTILPPGSFTAILAGKNAGVGIGLIEIYNLQ